MAGASKLRGAVQVETTRYLTQTKKPYSKAIQTADGGQKSLVLLRRRPLGSLFVHIREMGCFFWLPGASTA